MATSAPTFFKTAAAYRRWLEKNHDTSTELFIGFYKKGASKRGIAYAEAVDESLCFGWIDGVVRGIDDECYMQRYTPRKLKSYWSAVNLRKVARLQDAGLMHQAGLAALARRPADSGSRYSFEREATTFPPAMQRAFKATAGAWAFFARQPPGYRKLMTHWVTGAKQEATRARRLEKLMAASAAEKRLER